MRDMSGEQELSGPDLAQGISSSDLEDGGKLLGHSGGEPVLVVRKGEEIFAIGATCTHYGGPLAEGLVVGDTVRCPWHHACFSLRTGEAVRAPAFDPLPRWRVEREGDRVVVRETLTAPAPRRAAPSTDVPGQIVILGGGGAGFAAAERLRREGYAGALTMLSDDADAPYDRPNLSKDTLAGEVPEDQLPLRPAAWYEEAGIALRLRTRAT